MTARWTPGQTCPYLLSSGSNPRSSILSASSTTIALTLSSLTMLGREKTWSRSLPGVATIRSTPPRMAQICQGFVCVGGDVGGVGRGIPCGSGGGSLMGS